MNEQIKQLLLEAQELARAEIESTPEFAKYAPSYAIPGTEIHVGIRLSYQKFAELIVQEAADIAKQHVMNISTYADADFVDKQIKKHFGVEE